MSPTQRTMNALRHQGATCGVVEKWLQYAGPHGVLQDLFGFIDIIALSPGHGIIGIQCTTREHHAERRTKILEECTELAIEWLKCGGRIEVWSWAKQKVKRGGKLERWTPKVEEIVMEHFMVADDGRHGSDNQ